MNFFLPIKRDFRKYALGILWKFSKYREGSQHSEKLPLKFLELGSTKRFGNALEYEIQKSRNHMTRIFLFLKVLYAVMFRVVPHCPCYTATTRRLQCQSSQEWAKGGQGEQPDAPSPTLAEPRNSSPYSGWPFLWGALQFGVPAIQTAEIAGPDHYSWRFRFSWVLLQGWPK